MCGIAGIYEREGRTAPRELLLAMAGELRHRGPDGTGLLLDRRFGMVNTRLSIVDPEGGDQPLSSGDRRFWVMQNGEIYNAPELRRELGKRGHRFETHCDTEVLAHAYQEWGVECLPRLNGAFAFAIWDAWEEQLFLARDRFGIRPLFLAEPDGALCFASEAKALLRHPGASRELDPLGLVEGFSLWAAAPDRSAFSGVRELAPGHWLRLGPDRRIEEKRWWDLAFAAAGDPDPARPEELAEELLALLEDSTRLRLRADVPVGAYLSGGLDSSATAVLARRHSSAPLSSFAIRFEDPRFDERIHQEHMARELGTDLRGLEIRGPEIADVFPEVIRLAEKPLLRTAPAPMLLLSRLVRRSGLKVVLTGEGADELFAGYGIFREDKVRRFWARDPDSQLRPLLLNRLYPYLARDLGRSGGFLRGFFGRGLTETDDPLYSHRIRFRNGARCLGLLAGDLVERAGQAGDPEQRLLARLPAGFAGFGPLGRAQSLEIQTFLQGYLLHSQGDRMLMGNSVEGRFPFLDHRLAEFAARLPERLRLRALREKYLLRKAVAPLLPAGIAAREKRPYRAPILPAFVGPGSPDYVSELLSPDRLGRAGLFRPARVARLLDKCRSRLEQGVGETDEMALVGVLSTMLLHEGFVANPELRPSLEPGRVVTSRDIAPPRGQPLRRAG